MSLRVTLLRLATAVLGLFALALAVENLVSIALAARLGADAWAVAGAALAVAAWGVGLSLLALVVVWRVPDRTEALVAALVFGSFAAVFSGVDAGSRPPTDVSELIMRVTLGGFTSSIAVRFGQLFPRPLERSAVLALGRGPVSRTLLYVPVALLSPAVFWPSMALMELVVHSFQTPPALIAHILVYTGLAMLYLYAGYRSGTEEDRRRLFWLFEGALLLFTIELLEAIAFAAVGLGILPVAPELWMGWVWVLEGWIALSCFSLAVFYSGALDSRLVLRKTAVFSASGVLAVVLFVAMEELVSELVVDLLGVGSNAGTLFAGVLAALAFRPLTDRVEKVVRARRQPADGAPADMGAGATAE